MSDADGKNGNGGTKLTGKTLVPLGFVLGAMLLVWDWSAKAAKHEEQTQQTLKGLVAAVEELRRDLRNADRLREDFNTFVIELRALNSSIKVPEFKR